MANLLLIGAGPHARDSYLKCPHVYRGIMSIEAIVELSTFKDDLKEITQNYESIPEIILTPHFKSEVIPFDLAQKLDLIVKQRGIDGVIISSEPQTHFAYASWALDSGLSILIDKPVIALEKSISHPENASSIIKQFDRLLSKSRAVRSRQQYIFSVNTQRRFHPGFAYVKSEIDSVVDATGCGITNILSSHADGQLRSPSELANIEYHGFNKGMGKISHSGYHFIDIMLHLMGSTFEASNAAIDSITIQTSIVDPLGCVSMIGKRGFEHIFGVSDHKKRGKDYLSTHERDFVEFGEVDARLSLGFLSTGKMVSMGTINLLHNSLSSRTHIVSNNDLYHGNGRLKHEWHQIYQGPFQNIQIHSYKNCKDSRELKQINNTYHFDVYVYRHPSIKNKELVSKFTIEDFIDDYGVFKIGNKLVSSKNIKHSALLEFVSAICGDMSHLTMKSDIESHRTSNLIMSNAYLSAIDKSGKVEFEAA